MTRNSKSNKDGSVFTYYERHRMRHGSETLRLPGGALKPWHHCALSLSPATDPVITPAGVVYDREAIVRHLLKQKQDAARRTAEQEREDVRMRAQLDRDRERCRVMREDALEQARYTRGGDGGSVIISEGREDSGNDGQKIQQQKPNFWLPGAANTSAAVKKRSGNNAAAARRGGDGGDGDETNGDGQRSSSSASATGTTAKRRRTSTVSHDGADGTPQGGEHDTGDNDAEDNDNDVDRNAVAGDDNSKKRKRSKADRDRDRTRCPVTGQPLRLKHLISLKLHFIKPSSSAPSPSLASPSESDDDDDDDDDDDENNNNNTKKNTSASNSTSTRTGGYDPTVMCPMCVTPLTNAAKPVALRTGTVLCARCVDRFVRAGGANGTDPVTGQVVDVGRDVVVVSNQGTAFAGSSADNPESREARIYRPSVT